MGSDRNLINAAFAETKTRYSGEYFDTSKLHQSTADISKAYMDMVGGIMNEIKLEKDLLKKKKEQVKARFMSIADENLGSLYVNEEPLPEAIINLAENAVQDMADRFDLVNTIGENDTKENRRARRQILAELTLLTNKLKDTRTTFMDRSDVIKNDLANERVYNYEDIHLAAIAFDTKNMDENVKNGKLQLGYNKDGVFFNVLDDNGDFKTLSLDEISSTFAPINADLATAYITRTENSKRRGLLHGADPDASFAYDENEFQVFFKDLIKDKKDFDDFAYESITGLNDEPSFEDSVYENAELMGIPFSALDNMMVNENNQIVNIGETYKTLDLDGNQIINSLDGSKAAEMFANNPDELKKYKENVKNMIDAIVNVNNPAFNLETSRDLMAKYYMTYDQQKYTLAFNFEADKRKRANDRNRTSRIPNYIVGAQQFNAQDFEVNFGTFINKIENPETYYSDGETFQSPSGFTYKYQGGQFFQTVVDNNGQLLDKPVTVEDIAKNDKIIDYVRYPKGKYHTERTRRYSTIELNMYETIGNTDVRVYELGEMSLDEAKATINSAYDTSMFTTDGKTLTSDGRTFRLNSKANLDDLWRYLASDTFLDKI
tara:strand:+ start:1277 stop:3088 length:1812 start_codon:yes stop_codon:yes gene_type:complete